jgi:hypothetical protein
MVLQRYRAAVNALSVRSGVPLPSLIVSFGILHEITAIVPTIGFFYAAKGLGIGSTFASAITNEDNWPKDSAIAQYSQAKCKKWMSEGEQWAARVGRRYGVFGFEKGTPVHSGDNKAGYNATDIVGGIGNAIFAYTVTKVHTYHILTTVPYSKHFFCRHCSQSELAYHSISHPHSPDGLSNPFVSWQ